MKVLIVDDERPARDRLRTLLEHEPDHVVVGEAASGSDALALSNELQPDAVLLDIRMPGLDGIETAHHLNALERPPAVIFATAYDEYAIDAFEAKAVGYVLKPVRRHKLTAALENATRITTATLSDIASDAGIRAAREHVCARVHGELQLVPIDDIVSFRADQKYVAVDHDGGEVLIDDSLKSLESEFGDRFVRIHRSALVAVGRIAAVEKTTGGRYRIALRGNSQLEGKELIISRRHLADVRRRLKHG